MLKLNEKEERQRYNVHSILHFIYMKIARTVCIVIHKYTFQM